MNKSTHQKNRITTSPPTATKRAAVYARQSLTRGDLDDSLSLDFQQAKGKSYIADRGFTFAGAFVDGDTKGWQRHRPQFDRMLALVRGGQIDVIVVYKLSRFFRGLVEQESLIAEIADAGGELVSVTEPWVSASPMVRQILGAINEDHRRELADYLRAAFEARGRRGLHHGVAPFGYRITGASDRALVVDEDAAALVRDIFAAGLAGHGATAIAADLNARGVPAAGGGTWATKVIHRILRNAAYAGNTVLHGTVVGEGAHEAIIEASDFDRLQTILASRTRVRAKPDDVSWTDGFVEHVCGARMYLTNWPARTTGMPWRYRCADRLMGRGCQEPGGSAWPEAIESAFVVALGERLSGLLTPAEIIDQIERQREEPARDRQRRLARLERRISEVGKRRTKLLDMALAGTVDDDLYRERDGTLKAELARLVAERDDIPEPPDPEDIAVTHAEVTDLARHIGIVAREAPAELPPLLHSTGARLVWSGKGLPAHVRLSDDLESFFAP